MTRGPAADLHTALAHHQAGRFDQAEALYRALLAAQPDHADALHLLGVLRLQQDDPAEAAALIARAIERNAGVAYYHGNLAEAYLRLGRIVDAVAASRREVTLAPSEQARHRLGRCLNAAGAAAQKAGDFASAERLYEQALTLASNLAEASSNLGSLRQRAGDDAAAIAHYRKALTTAPDLAPTLLILGKALGRLGNYAEAAEALMRYTALAPADHQAKLLLGEALESAGDRDGALAAFLAAAKSGPWLSESLFRAGRVLRDSGRLHDARDAFRQALQADPDFDGARIALFSTLNWLCAWEERDALLPTLPACVERIASGSEPVETLFPLAVELPYVPADPALHRRVLDVIARGLDQGRSAHGPVEAEPARLHVGYVSPDFGDHPISQVCRRLFALHDRSRFTVTCYALDDRDAASPLRAEIEASADRFVSLAGLSEEQAVERIVGDAVHILVDLTGY
ncbi:MAG: hypothetical protein CMM50_02520, partial [Rhodospirillaceae bacterium]|nr:hypothetical protein [Rhodospirillaceae bacterium]